MTNQNLKLLNELKTFMKDTVSGDIDYARCEELMENLDDLIINVEDYISSKDAIDKSWRIG